MIIHKLEMYNFRQFIGLQEIDFSTDPEKNVTVLIGVNTSGKTTIIRAFEWCLYGKNAFDNHVLLNTEVQNSMKINETQDVWVAITFSHADSSGERKYTLKRKLKYLCTGKGVVDENTVTEFHKKPEEDLSLTYLQADGQTKADIREDSILESINEVLPQDLSDYFFFGGERISAIASRDDLTKAVKGLMGLDILENAREHIKEVLKKFQNNIDTSGDDKAQKTKDSLETAKGRKLHLEDTAGNLKNEMEYYQEKERDANIELANSNKDQVQRAKKERDRIQQALANEQTRLEDAIKDYVDSFNNKPCAFFGMPAIKKSLEILQGMKDQVECVPGMEQASIDYLIQRGICICGTHLTPDSIPYNLLIKERRKLPPEAIGGVVSNYKEKAEEYLVDSEQFSYNIFKKYQNIRKIRENIGYLKDDEQRVSELITDDTDAKEIERRLKDARTKYMEAQSDYDNVMRDIGSCEKAIKDCETALDLYAKNSNKNRKLAKYITYTVAIQDWLSEKCANKENILRNELEKRVNDNFNNMYHGTREITIDDKYRVKYKGPKIDESTGLKAVKSFAFIASLVSMAKDKILDDENMEVGQVYPLVMDAPFSNVDEIHIANICDILPNAANQIIMAVMEKDWNFAASKLNQHVGKRYTIVKARDENGKEIDTKTYIR